MHIYGATVYVRFDGQDERIQNMMNIHHKDYDKIPEEIFRLRETLKDKHESILPLNFRYYHADELFEMMALLIRYEDAIDLVLELEEKIKELGYDVMITAGFGTIHLPRGYTKLSPIEVLNKVVGHGVYSAFQYFKLKKKRGFKKNYPYFFYSYHHDYSHFNVGRETLEKRKEILQQELRELQHIDEKTQRHTYYLGHIFSK